MRAVFSRFSSIFVSVPSQPIFTREPETESCKVMRNDDSSRCSEEMEGNRDEAEKCRRLAEKYLREGNRDKALKLLEKSQRLYPSKAVEALIEETSKNGVSAGKSTGNHEDSASNVRHQSTSQNGQNGHAQEGGDYTQEELQAVKKIKKCKDYYEILGVNKEASEAEIKKQYRKLALQFHPDKNRAPGATDAFKAISNAYAVLTDPKKKKMYDQYGHESPQPAAREYGYYDYSRGFEADITPEEIFNMFFGGSMPGGRVHINRRHRHRHRNHVHEYEDNDQPLGHAFIQYLPILLLLILSLLSSLMLSDPPYSLHRSHSYNVERHTQRRGISYFVQDGFEESYKNEAHLRSLERKVEDEYITRLQTQCYRERQYREELLARGRFWRDQSLIDKAKGLTMRSCNRLEELAMKS